MYVYRERKLTNIRHVNKRSKKSINYKSLTTMNFRAEFLYREMEIFQFFANNSMNVSRNYCYYYYRSNVKTLLLPETVKSHFE